MLSAPAALLLREDAAGHCTSCQPPAPEPGLTAGCPSCRLRDQIKQEELVKVEEEDEDEEVHFGVMTATAVLPQHV